MGNQIRRVSYYIKSVILTLPFHAALCIESSAVKVKDLANVVLRP